MLPSAGSDRHTVISQSAVILSLGWFVAPLQFLTAVIVARTVGPEGKGALALLTGLTAILVSLIGLGLPSGVAVLYRAGLQPKAEVVGTALSVTAASSALLLLACIFGWTTVVLAVLSERELASLQPVWILLAVAAVAPAAFSAVADVVLITANAMPLYAVRSASSGLLAVALTWLLTFYLGWGVTGALASYPIAALFGLAMFAYWWGTQEDLGRLRSSMRCAGGLLRVGMQQHAISLVALCSKRLDVFLIASVLSLQDAGFYAAGILIPQAIVSIPRATMWPLVSALPSGRTDVPDAVAQISRLQVLLMALISLALFPLAALIVTTLFGEAFAPAVAPFRWALAGLAFTPVTITVNAILTARSQPGLSILSAVLGAGIQLIVMIVLIPKWGTSGAAAALSANFITTAVVQLAILRSRGIRSGALLIPRPHDFGDLGRALRARAAP
jgi:O-antigen/teichoic acid export membrane protein